MFLHLVLLPAVSGAYNDNCYLSKEKLNSLRYAIQKISQMMEQCNKTYWLDYGTLLGAMQYGDVLPWDGDADISYLYDPSGEIEVHKRLFEHGIKSNGLQARYNGMSIDYVRWTQSNGTFRGIKQILLNKYYPKSMMDKEILIVRYQHKLDTFPLSWIVPVRKVNFHGVEVTVPNAAERLLTYRYPYTYFLGINTPYKWKCWVPCWFTGSQNCKQPTS